MTSGLRETKPKGHIYPEMNKLAEYSSVVDGGAVGQREARSSSGLLEHGVERTADDDPANLAGAGADLVELGVAQVASGGVVVDVAVPSWGEETRSEQEPPPQPGFPGPGGGGRCLPKHWMP